jgi:hypothetical protein
MASWFVCYGRNLQRCTNGLLSIRPWTRQNDIRSRAFRGESGCSRLGLDIHPSQFNFSDDARQEPGKLAKKQARSAIELHLDSVTAKLKRQRDKVLIKWRLLIRQL